jgi:hypothetical protein
MLEQIFAIVLQSVLPFLIGGGGVWLYYRNKFTEVLTELEDKKTIIKAIHDHADEIEKVNVKRVAKQPKETTKKVAKQPKEKTKKVVKKTDKK